ncbi:hypothetical protein CIB84_011193 [Bambusicola thoracicus]|nr:hypothetical protein CIB84_011193 [Bambusicola thoracicus]
MLKTSTGFSLAIHPC